MKRFTVAVLAALVAACGGSDSRMSNADPSAYRSAALQVSDSVTSYATATTSMATPAECAAAVQQHENTVEPVLQRMGPMAGHMDDAMHAMGQTMSADMECGVAVMQQEMQHHLGVACASADMPANRAEAQRHVQAMQALTDHMQMRAEQMSTLMGGGMNGGRMMMQGGSTAPANGSWTMPDGGTMSWDDPMPGCS